MTAPILTGEQALLRPTEPGDFDALLGILQQPEVRVWWGNFDAQRLRRELGSEESTPWTIEVDGAVAGLLEATEEREPDYRFVELDLFLGEDFTGRGLGRDVLRAALRHYFEERGHHRAVIVPAADNERAIRSYEAVGFSRVGVQRRSERGPDGQWRDTLAMELLAGELR